MATPADIAGEPHASANYWRGNTAPPHLIRYNPLMREIAPVLQILLFTQLFARMFAQTPLPSEMPAKFTPVTDSFDYIKRDVMIPMRDGVKLHTVILVPKGASAAPILLTRTPYNATEFTSHTHSGHLGSILNGYDNATEVII